MRCVQQERCRLQVFETLGCKAVRNRHRPDQRVASESSSSGVRSSRVMQLHDTHTSLTRNTGYVIQVRLVSKDSDGYSERRKPANDPKGTRWRDIAGRRRIKVESERCRTQIYSELCILKP